MAIEEKEPSREHREPEPPPLAGDAPRVRVEPREAGANPARPLRCPYCHADVTVDLEPSVACERCDARHHLACWRESGRCAACRDARRIPPEGGPPGSRLRRRARTLFLGLAFAAVCLGVPSVATVAIRLGVSADEQRSRQRSLEALAASDLQTAKYELSRYLEAHPREAWAYGARARAEEGLHDDTGALLDYGRALDLDPRDAELWLRRGLVRARHHDTTAARADLRRALALSPANETARGELERLGDGGSPTGRR